jgi:hypothetical protein
MAYLLQAFICKSIDTDCLTKQFDKAIKVDIGQELSLIPMTEELFDQINELEISESIDGFTYLTETVEKKILLNIRERQFSYVEADYFGGQGGQIAITWQDRKRQNIFSYGQGRINQVLKLFGVIANKGQDEFDTLGLGLHRETNDWLETQK